MEKTEAAKGGGQHLVEHREALGKGLTVCKDLTVCPGGSDTPALLSALRTGHSRVWGADQCEGHPVIWEEKEGCVPADEGRVSSESHGGLDVRV